MEETSVLSETIEGIDGPVARMFFIPESLKDREKLTKEIEDHGGRVVNVTNAMTYQIWDIEKGGEVNEDEMKKTYYNGDVFSKEIITEAIKKNKWEKEFRYLVHSVKESELQPKKRKGIIKLWTLTEIIKLFKSVNHSKPLDALNLKKIIHYFPDRTVS
jgi:hypothetical protein